MLADLLGVVRAESVPACAVAVELDPAAVRADDEVVHVHAHDDVVQRVRDVDAQAVIATGAVAVRLGSAVGKIGVQSGQQRQPCGEQPLSQGCGHAAIGSSRIGVEELQVAAEVEDVEVTLVLAWSEQVGAQAGASAEHLPELRLRPDRFEEDEVDDFGDVDAGVEHVDADGDVRCLVLDREVVDQRLGVLGLVGDDAGERAGVLGVVGVEAGPDELGVVVVAGEDDRLAEPVTPGNAMPAGHQRLEHLVHGVGVEQPLVDCVRGDQVGDVAVLVPFARVPRVLLFLGEVVVADPLPGELQLHRHRERREEVALGDGLSNG